MRVAVIGAGIVGVTTAYELAAQGHEVGVFERRGSVASEASFANAGITTPWAAPGRQRVSLRGARAVGKLHWLWHQWRASRPAAAAGPQRALQQLAQLSRARQQELAHTLRLEYEQATGVLVLLRGERDLKNLQAELSLMRELGVAHELIDAHRCRQIEPGLSLDTALHAAIHLPQDGLGNCRHFAHLLKAEATRLGAQFNFEREVLRIAPGPRPALALAGGQIDCDAVVVCAGLDANTLLRPLGLKLPLAAVRGYSVTAPLRHLDSHPDLGPKAALLDARQQVAITRLGQRLRVAGRAEIGDVSGKQAAAALASLYRVLDDWFPGAALTREAQHWQGMRPTLPDGPPVVGDSGAPGVWLNLGHGASGWALACGSARVLAECIAGRQAPLDTSGLGIARLR